MKVLLALLAVLALSGCISPGVPTTQQGTPVRDISSLFGPQPGQKAPDFSLTTIGGKTIRLSELTEREKPAIVYFFATWCPTCTLDLSQAIQVYPAYKDKIEFIAVDIDAEEDAEAIKTYIRAHGFEALGNFVPASDGVLVDYRVAETSTKYLIRKDGIIAFTHSGATTSEGWKQMFDMLA